MYVEQDTVSIWATVQLKESSDLLNTVSLNCVSVKTDKGQFTRPVTVGYMYMLKSASSPAVITAVTLTVTVAVASAHGAVPATV